MDQSKALSTARQAFELWQEGRLDEAERRYRDALVDADPRHYMTPTLHQEYASVLTALHRAMEAGAHFERALQLELKNDPDEASAPVVLARYLLGEHYLRVGEADSARRVVAPSLAAADKPLAWLVEAEALWLAGSVEDARAAGERAIALCTADGQRERIRERLQPLWSPA